MADETTAENKEEQEAPVIKPKTKNREVLTMPTSTFNTNSGETIARELLILYQNTGSSSSPTWSPVGKRVEDSTVEYDWSDETIQDILGNTYTTMKKPVITQSFDAYKLDSGDSAIVADWEDAIKNHNPQALCNKDLLLVHFYAGTTSSPFAERYPTSAIKPSSLGGEGGGSLEMPFDVTFGGERVTGTASKDSTSGAITFTPAS